MVFFLNNHHIEVAQLDGEEDFKAVENAASGTTTSSSSTSSSLSTPPGRP